MTSRPIADYAMLSDCRSAALVSRDGSIDWLCLPRFDSPSIFARLLDEQAGAWVLRPSAIKAVERRYRGRSLVVETSFSTATGTCLLVDAMAFGLGERGHQLGLASPHVLLRRMTCLEGEVDVELNLATRAGYGLEAPRSRGTREGAEFLFSAGSLLLTSSLPVDIQHADVTATHRLTSGESWELALAFAEPREHPTVLPAAEVAQRLEDTTEAWLSWSAQHQNYEGPWADLVYRSGSLLQALTYRPTGAMVAAPTTSLPEEVGGIRNWDYRFSWLRDSSLTLNALWVAACPDEAGDYFRWIAETASRDADLGLDMQILYRVGGERDAAEQELTHLRGWRDSRPVRVGNAAADQRQVDVYGEILGAAHRLLPDVRFMTPETGGFLADMVDRAVESWREPDQGIWEVRGPARHFLHSKLMCWVAVDRGLAMADRLGARDRIPAWEKARDEMRRAIERQGWNSSARSFTQYFGGEELDASALMMLVTGFLPPDDPRMRATLQAVEKGLRDERGLLLRYRADGGSVDGLPGREGSFLLCTYWLAECLALSGQPDRAREYFERATAFANDVGLLSEEVDGATGEMLGNFPQALSHVGLVNAAWAIAEAEGGTPPTP